MDVLDEVRKSYILNIMKNKKRADERPFDAYRSINVEKGVIKTAEGSAQVRIGDTQVLVGIKVDVGEPFPDRPDEGVITTNAELLPLASPGFEPGPPDENCIELARIVDRGIRSSNAIDLKTLLIEENKVWVIFFDIYVLDHDGNLIDASALAAMAALLNLKLPKYEDGKVIREESTPLKVNTKAVSCTFAKIGNEIVLDPSLDEEIAMDGRLTIATTPNSICAAQKAGKAGFTKEEILSCMDIAFRKGDELRALI
ncbi:MAG: exosome complex protein Rrp42 [Candidatus Micrarchaeia archaeon]